MSNDELAEVERLKTERDYWRKIVGSDARYTTKRITFLLEENAALRDIVEAVAAMDAKPENGDGWPECIFHCAAGELGTPNHAPDCPVTKARTIFAANGRVGDRRGERE